MATGFASSGLCMMAVSGCSYQLLLLQRRERERERDKEEEKEREIDNKKKRQKYKTDPLTFRLFHFSHLTFSFVILVL